MSDNDPEMDDAVKRLAETSARLDTARQVLEFIVEQRTQFKCDCATPDFHHDHCPIGRAINALDDIKDG